LSRPAGWSGQFIGLTLPFCLVCYKLAAFLHKYFFLREKGCETTAAKKKLDFIYLNIWILSAATTAAVVDFMVASHRFGCLMQRLVGAHASLFFPLLTELLVHIPSQRKVVCP
jgi:hypothetical protein